MNDDRTTLTPLARWRLVGVLLAAALLVSHRIIAENPDVRAWLVAPATAAPGARIPVSVQTVIGSRWHVNSHTPSEKFLIPTVATLTSSGGALSPVRYPSGIAKRFSFSDRPLEVYEGTVWFDSALVVPSDARGSLRVHGLLAFQACNDQQCFPPARIPLEATIQIAPGQR